MFFEKKKRKRMFLKTVVECAKACHTNCHLLVLWPFRTIGFHQQALMSLQKRKERYLETLNLYFKIISVIFAALLMLH
jgi:hypothetical protein